MLTAVQSRPTETGSAVAGALAYLICYLTGVTDETFYLALGIVLAFLPATITWIVTLVRG